MSGWTKVSDAHQRRIESLEYANIYFSSSFVANEYGKSKRESKSMFMNFDKLELLRCNRARRSGHGDHQLWSQGFESQKLQDIHSEYIAAHCRIDPIDLVLGRFLSYESMRHWMS